MRGGGVSLDIVCDRCAECFEPLKAAPLGGRYVCETHPRAGYWSIERPEDGNTDRARLVSKHGRPTLHYYGRFR